MARSRNEKERLELLYIINNAFLDYWHRKMPMDNIEEVLEQKYKFKFIYHKPPCLDKEIYDIDFQNDRLKLLFYIKYKR